MSQPSTTDFSPSTHCESCGYTVNIQTEYDEIQRLTLQNAELLKVLKEAKKDLVELRQCHGGLDDLTLKAITAAIAKAEGRQP
ncbi:MAG TPA: hypothetical protein VEH27_00650 [Methylomirabilota bacterium]|nr:hypothetical protein [Methylomirabilota bacterium]